MLKLKTKSALKALQGNRREALISSPISVYGMISGTKQIRQLRGTSVLFKSDGDKIKKDDLPNA